MEFVLAELAARDARIEQLDKENTEWQRVLNENLTASNEMSDTIVTQAATIAELREALLSAKNCLDMVRWPSDVEEENDSVRIESFRIAEVLASPPH